MKKHIISTLENLKNEYIFNNQFLYTAYADDTTFFSENKIL